MASDYERPAEMQAGVMWKGEIRRATYTLNDAARAWQAFRDFLNGTPEQWLEEMAVSVAEARLTGYDEGVRGGRILR